jgi:hypothetical protein
MKIRTVLIIVLFVVLASLIGVLLTLPGIGDREPYVEHFHTFGDWSESVPATCTEPGTFERKCTVCGEVKTRHTPSLGHILGDWEKTGSTYVKNCTQCGEKVEVQEIFDTTADEINYCLSPDRKSYIVLGVKSCKYGVIVIPNEVDGLKVVRVAENAFKNSKDIDTIILPDTLEEISANAFFGSSIRRIYIPDSVKTIGEYAFSECPNLEKLIFPNSLESIPGNLCAESEGLTEVYIPGSVKEIGENAFTRCKQLKKVTLSEGLLSIASRAFSQCAALEEIRVPESATVLGEYIFSACGSLKRATLPSTITEIPVQTFSQTSLESFQIPTGVKKLDRGCFAGTSLTEIDLPEGLTTLGSAVFSGCSSLKSLSIPEGILALDNFVLAGCTSLESLHLPASLITINVTAFHGTGDSLTNITVAPGNSKYSSDGKTLYNYKKVLLGAADGSIPKDVTGIYACAFYGRTALTEIYIPKNIVKIEGSAFEHCQSVTSITYEGTVAEWKEVELGMDWFIGSDIDVVHCSDGDTELVVERSPSMFD